MSDSARMLVVVAVLQGVAIAQDAPQKPPKPTQRQMEKAEEAHRGLFEAKPNAPAEAGRRTNRAAAALPRAGASRAKIHRKTFIDEHIFGRIAAGRYRNLWSALIRLVPQAGLSRRSAGAKADGGFP